METFEKMDKKYKQLVESSYGDCCDGVLSFSTSTLLLTTKYFIFGAR